MMLSKAILHILDFTSGVCVFSRQPLDFSDDMVLSYVEKHVAHVFSDTAQQRAQLSETTPFLKDLQAFETQEIDFIEWSVRASNALYEQLAISDLQTPMDVLAVEFTEDDQRFLAMICLLGKEAYTHQVADYNGVVSNEIIRHRAILPQPSQKAESYAIITSEHTVWLFEKKRKIDGGDVLVLQEKLLQCKPEPSVKEMVKAVSQIAEQVAEDYGLNPIETVSKAKYYMTQTAQDTQSFSAQEIGRHVFEDAPEMREAFVEQTQQVKMPERVRVTQPTAVRAAKNHKIRTDTGIEVTFPAEYFQNHEFIEFITQPDGTISIELRNIGKITNQ